MLQISDSKEEKLTCAMGTRMNSHYAVWYKSQNEENLLNMSYVWNPGDKM